MIIIFSDVPYKKNHTADVLVQAIFFLLKIFQRRFASLTNWNILLQFSRQDNHIGHNSQEGREESNEHQEVRNKETIEFEEALKQWCNR